MTWVGKPKPQPQIMVKAWTERNEGKLRSRKNYAVLWYRNIEGRVEAYCNGEWVEVGVKAAAELLFWRHIYPLIALIKYTNGFEVTVAVPVKKARKYGLLDCAVDLTVGANLPAEYPFISIRLPMWD